MNRIPIRIGCYGDGYLCAAGDRKKRQQRLKMPVLDWFEDTLSFLLPGDRSTLTAHLGSTPCDVHAIGLGFITPGMEDVGPLTAWSKEAQLQLLFYGAGDSDRMSIGSRGDAYTVRVENMKQLRNPIPVTHRMSRARREGGVATISRTVPLFIPCMEDGVKARACFFKTSPEKVRWPSVGKQPSLDESQFLPLLRLLRAANFEGDDTIIPMIILPASIAFLMVHQRWLEVLLRQSWHWLCYTPFEERQLRKRYSPDTELAEQVGPNDRCRRCH